MASSKQKNQNPSIFACFDTNVIINLLISYNTQKGIMPNVPAKYNKKTINRILDLLRKQQINIIILPIVLKEIEKVTQKLKNKYSKFENFGYDEFLEEFKSNIYIVNFAPEPEKEQKYYEEVMWLATMYSRYQTVRDKKGKVKEISPIFSKHYGRPSCDARVMAQATILSSAFVDLYVVTGDSDFFKDGNDRNIHTINQKLAERGTMPIESGKFCEKFDKIAKFYEKQNQSEYVPNCLMQYDYAPSNSEGLCL
ncbi:MAG: hypothetical protein PHC47_00315 [Clostridia bacterium]|mgnify:CR=1 FL=1|jgi:predicted nucleic acid-binding protein|nr:hypothetical protein [Clostridia bacterium]